MTRRALGDVPKMPRHRSLRAIHSGSSSYGRLPTNVMLRTSRLLRQRPHGELGVARADHVDRHRLAPLLDDRRRSHDVLEPVQRDEARVHEHPESVVRDFRSGSHQIVVGADPEPSQLGAWCAELGHEVLSVGVGVDEHAVGPAARQPVLERQPAPPEHAPWQLASVVGGLLQRHERVEEHRRASQPAHRLCGGDVGVAGEPHHEQVGRLGQRAAHERGRAPGVRPRVGDVEHLGARATERLGHDPVPRVRGIEVTEVGHPEPGERRVHHSITRHGSGGRGATTNSVGGRRRWVDEELLGC